MPLPSTTTATDREVMAEVGRRLGALRRSQSLTAIEVAAQTGLSRRTVWRAEQGDNPTLLTLLRLLRLYGRLDQIDDFLREPEVSPMALLRAKGRGRADG